jgi:hypothetical protein
MLRMTLTAIAVSVYVLSIASPAFARCPPGTAYSCYQGMNGKVICGCR